MNTHLKTCLGLTLALISVIACTKADINLEAADSIGRNRNSLNGIENGRGLVSSSTGRSIRFIDIDSDVDNADSDSFVFGSTWVGACPGAPYAFDQGLTGYLNGQFQVFSSQHGPYRSISLGFLAPSGSTFDLARKCDGPDTYPVSGVFSLGTHSAQSPQNQNLFTTYIAPDDGIVSASIWLGATVVGPNMLGGYVGNNGGLTDANAVAFASVAPYASNGSDRMMSTSITFPVKRGDYYTVRASNTHVSTYPTMTYVAVPELGVQNYRRQTASPRAQIHTADADGFVVASAFTGACKDPSGVYTFQQVDGYMTDENGTMKRMAVESEYSPWRAVSITFPVIKGRQYRVGFYCADGYTKATQFFVPLANQ